MGAGDSEHGPRPRAAAAVEGRDTASGAGLGAAQLEVAGSCSGSERGQVGSGRTGGRKVNGAGGWTRSGKRSASLPEPADGWMSEPLWKGWLHPMGSVVPTRAIRARLAVLIGQVPGG